MTNLVKSLKADFVELNFVSDVRFSWSPSNKTVSYSQKDMQKDHGELTLLHEVGHALLGHNNFKTDLQLLSYEVSAWKEARILAKKYQVVLDENYIDECLESYRDWLYKRSTCVECSTNSMQNQSGVYICHLCGSKWRVPASQLCQVKRRKIKNTALK